MKITDIKTLIVHSAMDNWVFTRVYTDEGITGLGESSLEGRESTVCAAIEALKPYLVGKHPFDSELHFYRMFRDAYWGAGAILSGALSAIDGALWDIKGKAMGVPVYQLLGGKFRDKIRVYANRWFFGAKTPEQLAERAKATVSQGYTALKWDPFGLAEWEISSDQMERCLEEVQAVREAVGSKVELLIEGHGRFNYNTALKIAQELAPYKIFFFEEPLMPENIDALGRLHDHSPVAIAAGERFYTKYDFAQALRCNAIDYAQPDLRVTGGITEAKKIAALCESNFVPVVPHNIHGQVGTAMSLQLLAAIPNAAMLEYTVEQIPWKARLFSHVFEAENGYLKIPDRPGLGLEIDDKVAEEFPFRPQSLIELMFENH